MMLKEPVPKKMFYSSNARGFEIYIAVPVETAAEKRDKKLIHHGYRWRRQGIVYASNSKNARNIYRFFYGIPIGEQLKAVPINISIPDVRMNLREWKKVDVIYGMFNEWATDGLHHWFSRENRSACGKTFARFEVRTGKPRCPVCLDLWKIYSEFS